LLLLAVLVTGAGHWPDRADAAPAPPGVSLAPMLEAVLPAIVNISTRSAVQRRYNPLLDDPFCKRFFDLPDAAVPAAGCGMTVDSAYTDLIPAGRPMRPGVHAGT
jgi:serine protease Do/serine protease DegQ